MVFLMSLFKYFGEQGEAHRGKLFWSDVLDGLPFRGDSVPLLRESEIQEYVDVQWDFCCREFDLTDEKSAEEYRYVMDRVVNGWFYLHYREYAKDAQTGRVRYVYLEWSQRYGQLSPTYPGSRRASANAAASLPVEPQAGKKQAEEVKNAEQNSIRC